MKPKVCRNPPPIYGWALKCVECDDSWDYDHWYIAVHDAIIHNRWHVARRRRPSWADE